MAGCTDPGHGRKAPHPVRAPLHVDAAAHAALLAVERGTPGIYIGDDGAVAIVKARAQLGVKPACRAAP